MFFGLGSIGLRHLEALNKIAKFDIAAFRTKKGFKKVPEELEKKIKYFYKEKDAFAWNPDFMIVSNPTNLHLKYLLKSIDYRIDALIEKPIASDFTQIKKVEDKIKNRNNNIYIGYNLRFHPIITKIKEVIDSEKFGKVLKADLYVGEYLPFWHPYEDYRKSYAAKKELGGGVLRTLSHEIDLGRYLFGNYNRIFAKISKISDLDIDVDDSTDIFAEMENRIILKISMDYLNPLGIRKGEIFFETGLLKYNFLKKEIMLANYKNKENKILLKADYYDYNEQYKLQLINFLTKNNKELCSLEEGINVLKVIDRCEESNRKGRTIYV